MNSKAMFAMLLGLVAPLLAKRGIVLSPNLATELSIICTVCAGLVSHGVRFGIKDTRTTVSGLLGGLVLVIGAFGIDVGPDTQQALTSVAMTVIAFFARPPAANQNTSGGASGQGTTAPLEPLNSF